MQYICSGSAKALQRHCNCFAAALQKVCSNFAAVVCTILQHSFRAWQFKVINIPLHRHLQRTCQRLEDALYLMMFVLPSAFTLRFIRAASLKDLKKCRNISVGISPTFSRLNSASHTSHGRPPKSRHTWQRQSSIGRA